MKVSPINLPDVSYLTECLDYERDSGLMFWKVRPLNHFQCKPEFQQRTFKAWNKKYAGKLAMNHSQSPHGYKVGRLDKVNYLAHRIIWKLVNGVDPDEIDHINGQRTDNRIDNLRSVTPQKNQRNRSPRHDSVSGIVGVYFIPKTGHWQTNIRVGGRPKYLGTFSKLSDAVCARKKAEKKYGYISRPKEEGL